jgi:hypothetical protein
LYIIEVIEAESQEVMNTLTEHDFQDAFKNCRKAGDRAYARKGTTWRVMVSSRPEVSFDQRTVRVPEIMDTCGVPIYSNNECP